MLYQCLTPIKHIHDLGELQQSYNAKMAKRKSRPKVVVQFDEKTLAAFRKLGRAGGLIGGKARARKLTSEQRRNIARRAARARWRKSGH